MHCAFKSKNKLHAVHWILEVLHETHPIKCQLVFNIKEGFLSPYAMQLDYHAIIKCVFLIHCVNILIYSRRITWFKLVEKMSHQFLQDFSSHNFEKITILHFLITMYPSSTPASYFLVKLASVWERDNLH